MKKIIQESLSYIEENLLTEITASELAERAGYTLFHYYRIFQKEVGKPVMHYIQHRRLLHAIYEIGQGRTGIDVALRYGFDTYAGFYRAFIREFGCPPYVFLHRYPLRRPLLVEQQKEGTTMSIRHISKFLHFWNMETEQVTYVFDAGSGDHCEDVFYVGEHFVLKLTPNVNRIRKEKEFSEKLRAAGVCCAELIGTNDGRDWIEEDGIYYYMMSRLKGEPLCAEKLSFSYEDARYVGEMLGQLHLILAEIDTDAEQADLLQTLKSWAIPAVKAILPKQKAFWDAFLERFSELYPLLPQQIIHRDPNPANIICTENAWGVLDFELSERNVRIYDPCYAATSILSEQFDKAHEHWFATYHAIFDGYDSVVKLTDAEREASAYVTLANQIVCTAWFSEQEKYADLYRVNREMTEWLIDNFEKLKLD